MNKKSAVYRHFWCSEWLQSVDNISWQQYPTLIYNSVHCVWRICFLSTGQMHDKTLWTSFLFKHESWCVSFTCLSFCSCKMTSQTVEEKTLTNKLSLVPFLFALFSLTSVVYITSFSILSFSVFSFSLRWFSLTCLGVIYFFWCPSCLKSRERSSRWSVLKRSHAHPKRRWPEFMGAISHNTSFTHCQVLNLIHAWFRWKVVGNWSFSNNLWLTTLFSLS